MIGQWQKHVLSQDFLTQFISDTLPCLMFVDNCRSGSKRLFNNLVTELSFWIPKKQWQMMASRNLKSVGSLGNILCGYYGKLPNYLFLDTSFLTSHSKFGCRLPSVVLITSCRSFVSTTCYHYRNPLYAPFNSDDRGTSKERTSSSSKQNTESSSVKVVQVTLVPKQKGTASGAASSSDQKDRPKLDITKATTERNFLTPVRAMNEYLLKPDDLAGMRRFTRRSPYENEPPITVFLRRDVEAKALQVWGTWDAMRKELNKKKKLEDSYKETVLSVKKLLKEYKRQNDPEEKIRREIRETSGRVVVTAIVINLANFVFKSGAWAFTGSHSLFAESIHSLADTINQVILYIGLRKSIQKANEQHPYGYHSARYIASLISGVGIFCVGSGLSFYHGFQGFIDPTLQLESLYWAYLILGGSLLSEGGTCLIAFNALKSGAKKSKMSIRDFITSGRDPTVNVVLMEDAAAVLGVGIAASAMALSSYLGSPVYDAAGSIMIGSLLGVVATFIVYTNSNALIGKSIPESTLKNINSKLESDVMIRAIHDVKATDLGNDIVRYKAEVDIDGRQLTRHYLDTIDLETLLQEMKSIESIEGVESLMLKHGENIVDLIGAEIDRIEQEMKKSHPQLRHVDLEVL